MRKSRCLFWSVLVAFTPVAPAQDLTITPLAWINAEDAPDSLPQPSDRRKPDLPEQIKALGQPAYAEVRVVVAPSGAVARQEVAASSPWLRPEMPLLGRFKAAKRDGRDVWSEVRYLVIFNPATARESGSEATPRLIEVVPPAGLPARPGTSDTIVPVRAEVDEQGRVVGAQVLAGEERLAEEARRAVLRWRFAPARKNGVAVPASVEVPVVFGAFDAVAPGESHEMPEPVKRVRPVYPHGLRMSGLTGDVVVSFVVSREGRVRSAEVVRSSNPGFDEAALDAVTQWTFKPGKVKGVPVNTRMQVPIVFAISGEESRSPYRFNSKPEAQKGLPPELRFDHAPTVRGAVVPVYPFEALEARAGGKVVVRVVIDERGAVVATKVAESPRPDLGLAAQAMIECFEFTPASREGRPTPTAFAFEVTFDPVGTGDAPVSDRAASMMRALAKGNLKLALAKELDGPVTPVSQRRPRFPLDIPGDVASGRAVVEFIVDERGLVQLPRVIEASLPSFGYAAVQAVSTWRFRAPAITGDPVRVRVRQAITFDR